MSSESEFEAGVRLHNQLLAAAIGGRFEVGRRYRDGEGGEFVVQRVDGPHKYMGTPMPIEARNDEGGFHTYQLNGQYLDQGTNKRDLIPEPIDDDAGEVIELEVIEPEPVAAGTPASTLPPDTLAASVLPDSGCRTEFDTGAVRDAMSGKGVPSLVPPAAIRSLSRRFEDGATKYGRDNWLRGIPLSRYFDAIIRHTLAAAEGQTDEDHLGAVLWNAAAWIETERRIQCQQLPGSLDDLPYRE